MTRRRRALAALGWAALLLAGCRQPDTAAPPGQPLPDLTEEQLGRFLLGRALFERLTTPEEGLGPLYNAERCSACHGTPASGGSGPALVFKATRFDAGRCDPLEAEGGDNIQQRATPLLQARGIAHEAVPGAATGTARVTGPQLYGLGLIEAIPEAAILEREDVNDADRDGVSGRAARRGGHLARFGRKGDAASIEEFIDTALRFELGLTTPLHPREGTVNGGSLPAGVDPAPEPEIDDRGLRLLADYVRFLAPPPRESVAGAAADSVRQGERIFRSIGCATCHLPELRSGPDSVAALDRKAVRLYSDLLLHDLGDGLADVCGRDADPSEYRTAALWGLRLRPSLLHDGRAATPAEAIEAHGGEAAAAREALRRLPPARQALVLRFLLSL